MEILRKENGSVLSTKGTYHLQNDISRREKRNATAPKRQSLLSRWALPALLPSIKYDTHPRYHVHICKERQIIGRFDIEKQKPMDVEKGISLKGAPVSSCPTRERDLQEPKLWSLIRMSALGGQFWLNRDSTAVVAERYKAGESIEEMVRGL